MHEWKLAPGTRVVLTRNVDRYPHFIAPKGAAGEVVDHGQEDHLWVKLDVPVDGMEDWENEVLWALGDGDDPTGDLALENPAADHMGPPMLPTTPYPGLTVEAHVAAAIVHPNENWIRPLVIPRGTGRSSELCERAVRAGGFVQDAVVVLWVNGTDAEPLAFGQGDMAWAPMHPDGFDRPAWPGLEI